MNLEEFHFIRPIWLFAIIPFLVMLWLLLRRQLNSGNWAKVCDPQLLPHILVGKEGKRLAWPTYLLGIAGLLSILAMAGPTWERLPQPAFRDQSALVMMLDLSHSMSATDIKPNRLIRARFKVADILKRRKEGQTALIVYAGDAFTVTPLTDDTKTIASQLSILNTSLMPIQGSRTDLALEKAAALLHQAGLRSGHLLLLTDGVNQAAKNVANQLKTQNYQISILGVGTKEGAPIPLAQGGFLKNAQGAIVIPKLEETALRELAQSSGGIYQHITVNDSDINTLLTFFEQYTMKQQQQNKLLQVETWREAGPWLLLLVLPLAALAFRRGYLGVLLFLLVIPLPQPVHAWDWQSLWFTPDQQASRALEQGDTQTAAELFNDPAWKAAAQYKAGQYEQALQSLEGLSGADDWYNKGNALARLGRYPDAIEAYQKALGLNPEHENAEYNKKLVEEQLEKQQNSQNQDSKQQDSQAQESKPQDSQAQESKSQDSQAQDSKQQDSQDQDSKQQDSQTQDSKLQDSQDQESKPQESQDQASQQPKESQESQQQSATQAADSAKQQPAESHEQAVLPNESNELDETQQANEQRLREIIDDPGGLLRRKFQYQYQQARQRQPAVGQPW
jgi:Ca-activated chloride channel homolog